MIAVASPKGVKEKGNCGTLELSRFAPEDLAKERFRGNPYLYLYGWNFVGNVVSTVLVGKKKTDAFTDFLSHMRIRVALLQLAPLSVLLAVLPPNYVVSLLTSDAQDSIISTCTAESEAPIRSSALHACTHIAMCYH